MQEADLRAVLQACAGRAFDAELQAWVHSTAELPVAELLAAKGITLQADTPQPAQRLGLRVAENGAGIQVKTVLRAGPAEAAGLMAGDEWLGLEAAGQAWRLHRLDELPLYAGCATEVTALIARDRRLLRLPLSLPATGPSADTVRLDVQDAAVAQRWLGVANAA